MKLDSQSVGAIRSDTAKPNLAKMPEQQQGDNNMATGASSRARAAQDVQVELGADIAAERFDGSQVKEAVLSHVSQALAQARQRGVDEDALQALKQEALAGVKTGFGQALDDLKEMNRLTPQLSEKIDQTLEDIEAAIVDEDFATLSDSEQAAKVAQEGGFVSQGYFRNNQSLNLMVRTRDGDQVQISLSHNTQMLASLRDDNQQILGRSLLEQSGALQFSVSGNLSEQEMTALDDIISQVGAIANRFFTGELDGAYELAQSLNIDGTQLSSLALNMKETTSVASAYSEISNAEKLPKGLSPLAGFVDQVMQQASKSEQSGFGRMLPVDLLDMLPDATQSRQNLLTDMRQLLGED